MRLGSLKDAAAALSITPAAAGQRVKALEEYLGIDLLVRSRSGLRPTPALAAAMEQLSDAFRRLSVVAETLEMHRGHEIHIAATSDFVDLWLKPRLALFRSLHPNILFCINGEGDVPIRLGEVDCQIVFGPTSDRAHCDTLFRDFALPISSPENTARIAKLRKRDRLEGFPLLHLDFYKDDPVVPDWSEWVQANGLRRTAPNRGIRFQRIASALDAVLANAGLTICGLALISEAVEDGRVSLPFPTKTGVMTAHTFNARFRQDSLSRPQVKRFRAWLTEQSAKTSAWLTRRAKLK